MTQQEARGTRSRPTRQIRADYALFRPIPTRWMDNDVYGHVNNVVYYAYFDTAVNGWLLDEKLMHFATSPAIFVVVETACAYFESLAFPDRIEAGIRIARLGGSSVTYEVGIFREGGSEAAAQGHFVHVHVDRASRRPVPIDGDLRLAMQRLIRPAGA